MGGVGEGLTRHRCSGHNGVVVGFAGLTPGLAQLSTGVHWASYRLIWATREKEKKD
jgi:hypothetical protein